MTKLHTFILSTLAAALGFALALPAPSQTASAQTPDGETPAEESVCDVVHVQNGGSPGLYGLCVAYCEAQDCHLSDDGDVPQSCINTSEKLLAKYESRRDPAVDPEMPCLPQGTECPCWTQELLDSLSPDYSSACSVAPDGSVSQWTAEGSYIGVTQNFPGLQQCVLVQPGSVFVAQVTDEELAACQAQTADFCAQ